jgi:cell volume regulation protein A
MEPFSVQAILGLFGLVILIGLAGELFFRRTGIPSGLFLIALGMTIGPGLGLVETRTVYILAPYFGTLALLIILFDGGLNLPLQKVMNEAPISLLFTVTVFTLTMTATAVFYTWMLEGDWLHGLLLGAIVGGTTPVIVMPVVAQLESPRNGRRCS